MKGTIISPTKLICMKLCVVLLLLLKNTSICFLLLLLYIIHYSVWPTTVHSTLRLRVLYELLSNGATNILATILNVDIVRWNQLISCRKTISILAKNFYYLLCLPEPKQKLSLQFFNFIKTYILPLPARLKTEPSQNWQVLCVEIFHTPIGKKTKCKLDPQITIFLSVIEVLRNCIHDTFCNF